MSMLLQNATDRLHLAAGVAARALVLAAAMLGGHGAIAAPNAYLSFYGLGAPTAQQVADLASGPFGHTGEWGTAQASASHTPQPALTAAVSQGRPPQPNVGRTLMLNVQHLSRFEIRGPATTTPVPIILINRYALETRQGAHASLTSSIEDPGSPTTSDTAQCQNQCKQAALREVPSTVASNKLLTLRQSLQLFGTRTSDMPDVTSSAEARWSLIIEPVWHRAHPAYSIVVDPPFGNDRLAWSDEEALIYVASNPDLILSPVSGSPDRAREHHDYFGRREGRATTGFDALRYTASYPDLIMAHGTDRAAAARHYQSWGFAEGRSASFDALRYVASHPDLISALGTDVELATRHYIEHGHAEGRSISFDPLQYLAAQTDLLLRLGRDVVQATVQYITEGYREGRTAVFAWAQYVASHLDLIQSRYTDAQSAASHFLNFGFAEGRRVTFDALSYLNNYVDLQAAFGADTTRAAAHFISNGLQEGRSAAVAPAHVGYGNKRILYVHVKFPDVADPFPVSDTATRAEAISQFYREVSGGLSVQSYEVRPWVHLARERQHYEALGDPRSALYADLIAAINAAHDARAFDVIAATVSTVRNGLGCTAFAQVGFTHQQQSYNRPLVVLGDLAPTPDGVSGCATKTDMIAHEIGHTYGFGHNMPFLCDTWEGDVPASLTDPLFHDSSCNAAHSQTVQYTYGERDVMGAYLGHPSSPLKMQAGWLKSFNIAELAPRQEALLTDYSSAYPGRKAARFSMGPNQAGEETFYWMEYRLTGGKSIEPFAPPSNFRSGALDRIQIWLNVNLPVEPFGGSYPAIAVTSFETGRVDPIDFRRYSPTQLRVGESYADPYRGIRITRGRNTIEGENIQASVSFARSALDLSPSNVGIEMKGESTSQVTVRNTGDATISQGTLTIGGRHPAAFWVVADTCRAQALAPGQSCTIDIGHLRTPGDTAAYFGTLQWRTSDPLRPTPAVGLIGRSAP